MPPIFRPLILLLALLAAAPRPGVAADDLGGNSGNYPPAYFATIREAMRAFGARDFEAAIKLVEKADLAFQVTPVSLNIRGAIAIEQQKYDEGRAFCLKALATDANFFPARFNLCEIPFVQGKYGEARALLQKLQETFPQEDLLKFRIFLTYLLEKNEDGARQLRDHVPFLSSSPIYYYTQAAWEFAHDNAAAAKTWLDRGHDVFPPSKHVNYVEVFYDLGWVERPGI